MPTTVGGGAVDDVAEEFVISVLLRGGDGDGDGWALELAAAVGVVVLLIRYAVVPYASGLAASLSGLHAAFAVAGGGDAGLDSATIARLPCYVVARRTGGGNNGDAAAGNATGVCPVCLGDMEEGETAREVPCCRHAFHARCVDAWLRLRPTCPVCRAKFR